MKKAITIIGTVLVILIVACFITYRVMFISKSEVKDIVIEHANIDKKDAKKWSIEFNYEDGMFLYEVDVIFNNQEYEYEINARTGKIILYKLDN